MEKAHVITSCNDKTIEHVLLAALLAAVRPDKKVVRLSELLSANLTPTIYLTNNVISILVDLSLIELDEPTAKGARLVRFNFPNDNSLLKQLINKLGDSEIGRTEKLGDLVQDLMAAECQQFVAYLASSYGVVTDIDFPPNPLLIEMLCCRSMREVHLLLWRSVKRLMEREGRIMVATNDAKSFFDRTIKEAYCLHDNQKKFGAITTSFERQKKFKRSALATIVFEYVIDCGDDYYSHSTIF
jgi:hypothetical protein